ncbi:DUF4386 family protein [Aestuariibacter salexigens]|uniref:DUF4386 family protein n=1 Tax=Aestuariibacter salexigens TaxID=226010 RepID=UPI0006844597|nr:DUF4386 family protein [Aestuariibacter salexigens]
MSECNIKIDNDIKFRRAGAVAFFMMPLCYVCMFVVFGALLSIPQTDVINDKIAYIASNQDMISVAYLSGYLVFGCLLLVAVQATHNMLSHRQSHLLNSASIFGLIWVVLMMCAGMTALVGMQTMSDMYSDGKGSAETVFYIYATVVNALGGGIEFLGGMWVLLVSMVALRQQQFPKPLGLFGCLVGVLGILTIYLAIPGFKDAFGLSQMVWFIWFGVAMLSKKSLAS